MRWEQCVEDYIAEVKTVIVVVDLELSHVPPDRSIHSKIRSNLRYLLSVVNLTKFMMFPLL